MYHSRPFYDNYCSANKQCVQSMSTVEELVQSCNDNNICTADSCNAMTATCTHQNQPVGTYCPPGRMCDGKGACVDCLTSIPVSTGTAVMRGCFGSPLQQWICLDTGAWGNPVACAADMQCYCVLPSTGVPSQTCAQNICGYPHGITISASATQQTVIITGVVNQADGHLRIYRGTGGAPIYESYGCSAGWQDPIAVQCPFTVTDTPAPGSYAYYATVDYAARTPFAAEQKSATTSSVTVTCPPTCMEGQRQCSGNVNQTCAPVNGCLAWTGTTTCPTSTTCQSGTCVPTTCSDTRSNVSVCGSRVCGDAKDNCGVMRNCGSCTSGTCNAAGQCESSCTDTRSNASVCELHVCGDVADSCGVQRNCGSCSEWQVCDAGSCKDASVVITVGSAGDVVAGNWFTLPFTLQPESSFFILRQPAWPPGATISNTPGSRSLSAVPGNDDVGTHTISLTIERVGVTTMVVGQTSTVISVLCNPKDPDVGACCGDSGAYKMDGSGCAYSVNETGTCTQHRCVRVCTANTARICVGNAVTHADSCGQPGDTIDNCGLNARTCVEVNGVASCAAAPQSCTGSYTYECRGPAGSQYGVRIDTGCGRTNTTVTCSASQTCTATDSGVSCRDKGLCDDLSGTIQCGQRCVGPLTSRTDCGGCGRQCGRNSQCSKGECRPIPGCSVVCDTNAQCGQDEVCINGGDCTRSQCQAVNILEQNRSTVEEIAAELTTSGLVRVATTIRKNVIAYTVTNLGPSPVTNVVITSTFGKVITGDATTLTVDGVGYEILRRDPVLRFSIPKLETTKEFTVTADHILDPTYINMIAHELNYTAAGDIIDAWNRTKEALSVGINSEYSGNRTTFHLTLNPSKSLGGVSVPLEIPKCLAEKAAQLQLSGKYQIIQEDPLIVWQFDDLERPTEVTFSVPGDIDEECKAQLRAMAFSQRIGKPLNPWLSLALIPIIGFLLIFFQRFTPELGKKERLSKDEFERIARQQGLPAEEVERHWRDYRRRF